MNLRKTVDDIRAGVVRSAARRNGQTGSQDQFAQLREEFHRLVLSYEQLCSIRNAVGRMPPSPKTLRAKASSILIRIVQRMLFWYTPQIHRFHNATAAVAENVCASIEKQIAAMQRLSGEIAEVRSEMRLRGSAGALSSAAGRAAAHDSDPCFDHVRFAFQNKLRGTPQDRQESLRQHLSGLDGLAPPVPAGVWLDIGCGRGDWIGVAGAAGHEVIGLEDNRLAVAHCASVGLHATFCDPLDYLRQTPDDEFAVISAMHVLNRFSARYTAELIRESARALKPGGVFLVESLNPSSLAAAAEGAWSDLDSVRPVPVSAAEFLLEYYGLAVVLHRDIESCPEERRLPFPELDFIRQLNAELYSPAAYVLFARSRKAADMDSSAFQAQPV